MDNSQAANKESEHADMLTRYADLTDRGNEPSYQWQLLKLGFIVSGSTDKDRARLARKMAARI